jgi:hypothetical protein
MMSRLSSFSEKRVNFNETEKQVYGMARKEKNKEIILQRERRCKRGLEEE